MPSTPSDVFMTGALVVGTDGSPDALRAVRWATGEAAARGTALHLVHATGIRLASPYLSEEDHRRIAAFGGSVLDDAAELARRLAPSVAVTTTLCEHGTTPCLLAEAGPGATVVVGSRGRGGFSSLLLGSDSLQVACHSPFPVVVVPAEDREPVGVVLAAVKDERDSETLRVAARLADRDGAVLRVVSAWVLLESVGNMASRFEGADRFAADRSGTVAEIVQTVRVDFPGLSVTEAVLRAGSVSEALVEATGEADLIVIGPRRHSHLVGSPLGHVAHAVLHHSHCPVVLVPQP
ncbi:universal stress protein [Streptomyces sp. NPDC052052]|uniref:universal stress protein n=1 Tax=Streptomyces sp. NPDC052052 TaxID=3154756 RepID=UPI00342B3DCF